MGGIFGGWIGIHNHWGFAFRNDQLVFLVCLHGFSFVKEQKRAGGLLYSSVLMYLFYLLTQNAIQ